MWSAPYTLDNVPITGYNINDDQGTLLDTVNTTEYIMTSSNDDPCTVTTVYVSGINGAGIGDSNNVMYNIGRGNILCYTVMLHFCYISVPQTIPVSVIPTVDGDNVLFQVFINVSLYTASVLDDISNVVSLYNNVELYYYIVKTYHFLSHYIVRFH